jgi:CRISPR-associated protein Cas2
VLELITLVIYDISDDDLRLRVAKFLKRMGLNRIQRSAFAGSLTSAQRAEVEAGLRRLVHGRNDVNIQIYPLTPASYSQRVMIGVELKYEDEELLI